MSDLRWFAGFFDGEGYVGAIYQKAWDSYTLRVSVTNNRLKPLKLFHRRFGGTLAKTGPRGRPTDKVAWTWHNYGPSAKRFLEEIEPHVVLKRDQVRLALQFPLGHPGRRVTKRVQAQRARICEQLKALKCHGVSDKGNKVLIRQSLQKREEIQRAVKLYESGMSAQSVATAIGENQPTVAYWLRELGVTREKHDAHQMAWARSTYAVQNRGEADRAEALYKDGIPIAEIARRLKKKPATVNYWLRRRGVTRSRKEAQQLRRKRERDPDFYDALQDSDGSVTTWKMKSRA